MSLYVRVMNSFYTHRKTLRLRTAIGDAAYWVPPRIWAYAAANQPDGCFDQYSAEELALLVAYLGDAQALLQALLQAGFLDSDPLRIHDWMEYNGYHAIFAERAKKAATARWAKNPPTPPSEKTVQDKTRQETSIATSINDPDLAHYHKNSRTVLHLLNEAAGTGYRETDKNLTFISERLREPGVTLDGVKQMIERQCKRWKDTTLADYLRPETLFNKTKFDGYYGTKDLPIGQPAAPTNPRNPTGRCT